ncbi:MAG: glycoside hydrolase family 3 N-terminal domain-containing protein [Patescibacteria group bacterium]|jgi:beta-N-acetylhexosaminidase
MKKNKIIIIISVIILAIILSLVFVKFKTAKPNPLKNWTLKQKVGQLMIVNFNGTEPDYYINKMILERNVGGVILMGANIKDNDQIKTLTNALQYNTTINEKQIPLFISIDQEGGIVTRLQDVEHTAEKDIKTEEQAIKVAKTRGEQLLSLGININLAPVLDFSTDKNSFIYSRTFENNLAETSKLAVATAKGYNQAKIIYVPKHFPGHFNSVIDSHQELPMILESEKEMLNNTKPFQEVINNQDPKIIMTSHTLYPKIDPKYPATLSKKILTDILRKKLKYNGLIMTDDLSMKALTKKYTLEEIAIKALQASNDILLFIGEPEEQVNVYNAIIKAVEDKKISEKEIDEKVIKILELKNQMQE